MRRAVALALALTVVLVATGCTPQTVGVPADGRQLHARFPTVQNLVVGHAVQVADVQVGTVTGIELDGHEAVVTLTVDDTVPVPEGTRAAIRQTSLLGEDFVALALPDGDPAAMPAVVDGGELPTGAGPPDLETVVEQSLRLLAAVTTDDVDTLVDTSVEILDGREEEIRRLLRDLAAVTDQYADRRDDLAAVIDGLAETGEGLAGSSGEIATLIDDTDRATAVLARQRERMVAALTGLSRLADAARGSVLGATRDELEASLAELGPVVSELAGDTERVDQLITRVLEFVDRIRQVVRNDEIELYGLMTPGDGPVSGVDALRELLEPPS